MGSRGTGSGGGPASVCGTLDVRVSLEHVCLADQLARSLLNNHEQKADDVLRLAVTMKLNMMI